MSEKKEEAKKKVEQVEVEDERYGEPGGHHVVHPDGRQDAVVFAKPYRAKSKVQRG